MHDSACAVSEAASYFFDDEGNLSRDTKIISNGILLRGICDEISASRLGTSPTGNGRRESSDRRAYTRMTNTYFEAGEDSLEDMIASVKHGFLLEEARNGMEDPKNWGIQCVVGIAREISDGALSGRIFSPVVLSGYVPDLLRSIRMTGRDFTLSGCGFCGKGHKEWVKVSDGGPYILARIKLG
jgi:TldD protein